MDRRAEKIELDVVEVGVYGQFLTAGIYAGFNDDADGISFGIIMQSSAGAAAYASGGVILTWGEPELSWNTGGGLAVPTGLSTPITGGVFWNKDGSYSASLGVGLPTDYAEAGVYEQATMRIVPIDPWYSDVF